ncbi:DUF423 domain-containing protein [bacterium]|nr:DUF423 domain-containing protein [bacterium]
MLGALSGALAVMIGAFGAHWLKSIMTPEELANFKTASEYHFIHSIMLVFVGYYANRKQKSKSLVVSGYAFLLGIVLFSFSLYAYAILAGWWFTIVTPIGGLCLIIGWGALAFEAISSRF